MIYKFRVFSDENEKFLRCIEIDENETFLKLHQTIQQYVGFSGTSPASFYLSNEQWERLTQISLTDTNDDDDDEVLLMDQNKLNDLITEEGENIVYVFDFEYDRVLYVVLSELKQRNPTLSYPLCSQKIGDPPAQSAMLGKNFKKIITGKIITNVKSTTKTVSVSSSKEASDKKKSVAGKPVAKQTKSEKEAAKPVKSESKPAKPAAKPAKDDAASKPSVLTELAAKAKAEKEKGKETKNQQKAVVTSSKTSKKKIKDDEDFDDDLDLDDDDIDMDTPKKKNTAKAGAKSAAATSKKKRIADDEDDEDFDEVDDIDLDDDIDDDDDIADVDDDFGYDDEDLEELTDLEDIDNFSKKISSKKFASIEDFEDDFNGNFEEDDDFYENGGVFDNIDDYNDRL